MNLNPEISCLMSVFNSEDTLKESIESIQNQTFDNFEFLIIDDASSDNSFEVIKGFENIDKRIKVYRNEENIGLTKSLNKLISLTSSKFIARQDGDDISLKSRFEKQISYIKEKNIDACTTLARGKQSKKTLHLKSRFIPKKLLLKFKNPFIHGSLMIKTSILKQIGGYDESFIYAQDYNLFTQLLDLNYDIEIINEVLYILNQESNISTNFKSEQEKFANYVKKGISPKNES